MKLNFNEINWNLCNKKISKLQEKLVVAYEAKDSNKIISLQRQIVDSFWGRALAVRKVTTNRGAQTPGIDQEIWNTASKKIDAVLRLKTKGYKAKPLRRIYLLKEDGTKRALSIRCMYDRAMQALYALALDPIAECVSDVRSYAFRKYKNTYDAIEYAYTCLSSSNRARFILKADIQKCFDNINHDWVLKNIPMDKKILKEFLKAGYIEHNKFYKTETGLFQGSIISPIIANMVLNGLEQTLKDVFKDHKSHKLGQPKVNIVRYGDDIIITGRSKELLTEKVLPAINNFLKERGLQLNSKKTKIFTIEEGFDFLGVTFRKHKAQNKPSGEICLITPSKASKLKFRKKISKIIKSKKKTNSGALISVLNSVIRGWANYFRICMAKKTFTDMDHYIWTKLWAWAQNKHPNMGLRKLKSMYFPATSKLKWDFLSKNKDGTTISLLKMATISILTYIHCLDKNPYLSVNEEYYENRRLKAISSNFVPSIAKILKKQKGICKVCNEPIFPNEEFDVHHIKPVKLGGKNQYSNLLVLHTDCHKHLTFTKNPSIIAKFIELGLTKPGEHL